MQQTSTRAIGQHHPTTVLFIELLLKGKTGEFLSDAALQRACGLPVAIGTAGYRYLMSAIKYVENRIVWKRIPTMAGIKCQESLEIVERSQHDIRLISRKVKRSSRRLLTVDAQSLPPDKRAIPLALAAQLGAMSLMSNPQSTKQLASAGTPQIGDAFKLFGK